MTPDEKLEKRLQTLELRADDIDSRLAAHVHEVAIMTGHYSRLADGVLALRGEVAIGLKKLDLVLERLGGKP